MRHFCASRGAALWEPCWECGALCGPGELHCGGCGVNLAAAFQKKLDDLQARLEQAQQLRQSHEHDRAIELLQDWPAAIHPKLTALRQQAERMIGQLQSDVAQAEQRARSTVLEDAQRFHDDGDFERAAELLSQLPTRLLTDPMRQLLEQTRDRQAESLVLASEIREHVDRKQADGLLPKVDRLLELKPHDAEAQSLQSRLRSWEARRMEARREQLSKLAISERNGINTPMPLGCWSKFLPMRGRRRWRSCCTIYRSVPRKFNGLSLTCEMPLCSTNTCCRSPSDCSSSNPTIPPPRKWLAT